MDATILESSNDLTEHPLMIARQPVYNEQMGVFGYELLSRPAAGNAHNATASEATSQVLTTALMSNGLEPIVYNRKAIINVSRAFLDVVAQVQLPPEKMVLDIPGRVRVDDALIAQLKDLKTMGYQISVGGFNKLKCPRLLSIADDFRVDVKSLRVDQLDQVTKLLRRFKNLSLRALRIETPEEFDVYRTRGYDYYQGFFLGSPRNYKVSDLSVSKLAIMELLTIAHNPNTPLEVLEERIVRDVSLSLKLLKLINSPFFGVAKEVDSIKRAILLLGRSEIRKFISLLALNAVSDRPRATIEIALLRAKTCELLGQRTGNPADALFTVGMLSALDIVMDQPIKKIVSNLPLSIDVKSAILEKKGLMGEALSCTVAMENARWADMHFSDMDTGDLFRVSVDALQWANSAMQHL